MNICNICYVTRAKFHSDGSAPVFITVNFEPWHGTGLSPWPCISAKICARLQSLVDHKLWGQVMQGEGTGFFMIFSINLGRERVPGRLLVLNFFWSVFLNQHPHITSWWPKSIPARSVETWWTGPRQTRPTRPLVLATFPERFIGTSVYGSIAQPPGFDGDEFADVIRLLRFFHWSPGRIVLNSQIFRYSQETIPKGVVSCPTGNPYLRKNLISTFINPTSTLLNFDLLEWNQGNLAARLQWCFFHTFVQLVLETCEM